MQKSTLFLLFIISIHLVKGQCPDLKITNAVLQSLSTKKIAYTLNFTNAGNVVAPLTGLTEDDQDNVKIVPYLSLDKNISTDDLQLTDIILGMAQLPSIKPDEVFAITFSDYTVSAQNYSFLILHIDSKNVLNECSESNNFFYLPLQSIKPSLIVSAIEKPSGSPVEIPVLGANFQNILGVQFSINTITSSIFRIDSVGFLGLPEWSKNDIRIKNSKAIGALWFSNQTKGISFDQKVQLFTIYGTIIGKPGECTDLKLDDSFLSIEFIGSNPLSKPIAPILVHGSVCVQKVIDCNGRITLSNSTPIPHAIVKANSETTLTDLNGFYKFKVLPGGNYTISVDKKDSYSLGLSIIDILLIKKHLLQIQALPNPYEIIAADVNGDLTISVQDIVLIRSLILGLIPDFGKTPVWQFIPKDYKFKNPNDPLKENYPISYNLEKVQSEKINLDFIGLKTGDVSLDALNSFSILETRSLAKINLQVDDQLIDANKKILVPIKLKAANIDGFQFSLSLDKNIKIEKITSSLPGFSGVNYYQKDSGLKIVWHAPHMETLNKEAEIVLHILSNKTMSTKNAVLKLSNELTPLLQDQHENIYSLSLEFNYPKKFQIIKENFEVFPNPFTDFISASFTSDDNKEVKWFVSTIEGKVVAGNRFTDLNPSGKFIKRIDLHHLPNGMYTITLITHRGTYTKKIIQNK